MTWFRRPPFLLLLLVAAFALAVPSVADDEAVTVAEEVDEEVAELGRLDIQMTHTAGPCDPGLSMGDEALLKYKGTLSNGTLFDQSDNFVFVLSDDGIIPGFLKGIVNMCVGEQRKLVIPPHLAYGANGTKRIPPDATITFEIELLNITLADVIAGREAFKKAVNDGDLEGVELGIAGGEDINLKDGDGRTPLHRAVFIGHYAVVKALLAAGADVHAPAPAGASVLHYAAGNEHKSILRKLIKAGIDVNVKISEGELEGYTALHFACKELTRERSNIVSILLQKGAALSKGVNGKTPLDLLKDVFKEVKPAYNSPRELSYFKMKKLLKKAAAKQKAANAAEQQVEGKTEL